MSLAMHLRKLVYLTTPVLLLFTFAGSASAQTLAQGPAAKYIGVDAYSTPTWAQVGSFGSQYYAGIPQSEKFFYKDGLPTSDTDTTSNGVDGCGAQNPDGSYVYPTSTLCVITYNAVTSTSDANLQSFLSSTASDPHQIILIFCNEPENGSNDNGCMCDFGTETNCSTPSNFITEFETESNEVKNFESQLPTPNVQFAEDSWGAHYQSGTGGCNFIAPPQYVKYYLVDIYEGRNGNPITQAESLGDDQGWKNWVSCTSAPGVDRGIAEFAINCGNEQKSLDNGQYEEAVAQSFSEDDTYLQTNFPHLVVWNLWDSGGCALDNQPGDEPDSIDAWQSIEFGN
jgi:hypothetical protein